MSSEGDQPEARRWVLSNIKRSPPSTKSDLKTHTLLRSAMRHVRDAVERSPFRGVAMFRTFSDAHYHKGDWDTPGANCKKDRPEETNKLSSKLLRHVFSSVSTFLNVCCLDTVPNLRSKLL